MKSWIKHLSLALLLTLFFVGCTRVSIPSSQAKPQGKKKVLCTINMISDLTSQIAQDKVNVETLIKKDLDPHSYELVKGDDEKLLSADLIFYNGLGLEHSPHICGLLKSHASSHAVGDYIQSRYPDLILKAQQQTDPHIWMDVSIWEKGVRLICDELCRLEPAHASFFKENAITLQKKMHDTHQEIISLMQEIPSQRRYLITCHDAFYYFTKSYLSDPDEKVSEKWRERFIAPEGLAPDCQLSTSDLQKVVHFLEKNDVGTIFPEYNVNLDSIYKIKEASDKSGIKVEIASSALYGDTMSSEQSSDESYLDMMLYNAKMIHHNLLKERE